MPEFNFLDFLFNLIVTVVIYSLPIIIVRYAILKRPIEKTKALTITIIYGIIAFLVMSVLIYALNGNGAAGGAILLWSYVNYCMLKGGSDNRKEPPTEGELKKKYASVLAEIDALPYNNEPEYDVALQSKELEQVSGSRLTEVDMSNGWIPESKSGDLVAAKKSVFQAKSELKKLKKEARNRPTVHTVPLWCFAVTVAVLLGAFTAYILISTNDYKQQITQLESSRDHYQTQYAKELKMRVAAEKEATEYMFDASFWDMNAVICTTNGKRYHHSECSHINWDSYYIFNVEYAEYLGYTPCLDCCYN